MSEDNYQGRQSVSDVIGKPSATLNNNNELQITCHEKVDAFFYTLDGSSPSISSKRYVQGVELFNHDFNRHLFLHKSSVAQQIGFVDAFPLEAYVVKSIAADKQRGLSKTHFKTFLTKNKVTNLKILSLGIDEKFFFDEWGGKSSFGRTFWNQKELMLNKRWWDWEANYKDEGFSSSSIGSFELLSSKGESIVSDNVRIRIHGNASRSFPQKSFRLESDSYYGSEKISGVFDENLNSFLVRNSGNDRGLSQFADAFMQEASRNLNVIIQSSEAVHLMINGCYWGVYNMRERFDTDFLKGVDQQTTGRIIVVSGDNNLKEGKQKDLEKYKGIKIELESSGSTKKKSQWLKEKVDLVNFMDYLIVESFFANSDWPHNNLKCFKQGKTDKWKWLIYDLDYGMSYTGEKAVEFNAFEKLKKHNGTSGAIFRHILKDDGLKDKFIARYLEVLSADFSIKQLQSKLESYRLKYKEDIKYQILRWRKPSSVDEWEAHIANHKTFILRRGDVVLKQLSEL